MVDNVDIIKIVDIWHSLCRECGAKFSYEIYDNTILFHTICFEENIQSRFWFKDGIFNIEYIGLPIGIQSRDFLKVFLDKIEKEDIIKEVHFFSVREKSLENFLTRRGYTPYTMSEFTRNCFKFCQLLGN